MTWAEVSPFLGLLALAAWGLWLRHRTMVKAMEHGYTQIGSESTEPECHTKPQPGTTPPAVDPVQWWGALTEQFQTIANEALRDMSAHASRATEHMAHSVQASTEAMASAQAAAAAAPAEAAATPRASAPPQSARAKPRKRPPPAPRAARASS